MAIITMKDIAKKANVSVTAVSTALNDKKGISEKKRREIKQIAREIGYSRNNVSYNISAQNGTILYLKSKTHGININVDQEIFNAQYIDGIEHTAKERGYSLEYSTFDKEQLLETVEAINKSKIKGVIVHGTDLVEDDLKIFTKLEAPFLCFDTQFDSITIDFIDMDNSNAVHQIIEWFKTNNYDTIGIIESKIKVKNFVLRKNAFLRGMDSFKLEVHPEFIYSVRPTFSGAYEDMKQILSCSPPLPPAIFAANDIIAYGAIKAFREYNIQVPKDISIIGFGDLPLQEVMDLPLSTIQVPKKEMGELAVQLLTNKIESISFIPPIKLLLGVKLLIKDSVIPKN